MYVRLQEEMVKVGRKQELERSLRLGEDRVLADTLLAFVAGHHPGYNINTSLI